MSFLSRLFRREAPPPGPVSRDVDLDSTDFRGGVDAKLAGFNLSFTGGIRHFNDESIFTLPAPHPGLTTTNNARLTAFSRIYPIEGNMSYAMFSAQREKSA